MSDHHGHGAAPHDAHHPSLGQRVLALARAERSDLGVVFVYAVGVGLLSLVVPIATASLINTVTFGVVLQPLAVLTFLVVLALGFDALLRAMQLRVVEMMQQRVFVRVALDLAHRLPLVRASAADRAHLPELVNRFFDVLTVQKAAATLLLDGLAVLLQALVGTALLAAYHPLLLAFDVALVLGMGAVLWPLGHGAIDTSLEESRAKYAVAAWLEELGRVGATFRGTDAAAFARGRAESLTRRYLVARASHFRVLLRQHVSALGLRAIASGALLGVGGWLVINRQLTVGQLAAAELVVGAVVVGMTKLSKQLEGVYDLVTAVDKIGHLTDLPVDRTDGAALPLGSPRGAGVELRGVYLAREGSSALRGADLSLAPGARAWVRGADGAGKSALADLLDGRRAPDAGVVLLDGADLRELSLDARHDALAVVREVEVFAGTVAENVALGRHRVGPEEVRAALSAAGLEDAVHSLPDGARTSLTPSGTPLSVTQARRLMFARAMAGRPRLLVVDGALDPLDDDPADPLLRALAAPDAPWTLLVLTQRAELAGRAESVVTLSDGRLTPGVGS